MTPSRKCRDALLAELYERFRVDRDTAVFVRAVDRSYTVATLARIARFGPRFLRRAATHALGLTGDFAVNGQLGRRMRDPDRGVRLLAEQLIREVWFRDGSHDQRHRLLSMRRLNREGRPRLACRLAARTIEETPGLAESWNQRAIARAVQGDFFGARQDCQRALQLNPYQFQAAVNMGRCFLEMADPRRGLECFCRALNVNPNLDGVRGRIAVLRKTLS